MSFSFVGPEKNANDLMHFNSAESTVPGRDDRPAKSHRGCNETVMDWIRFGAARERRARAEPPGPP
jgi:hypothetical protein